MTMASDSAGTLRRAIDWKGAFWVASGVPPLVLFSIGGIGGTVGNAAFLVWILSMAMGFIQSFTYAEISGLFPNKSGGASIYGATAWIRYSKFIAPLSVWCNWIAWSPVLSLGCAIAAGYILNAFFAADSAIMTWQLFRFELFFGIEMTVNAGFVIGAVLMLAIFAIQHRGILGTAKAQMILGIAVIVPLLIIGVVPLLTGDVVQANFEPLVPPAAAYTTDPGSWSGSGLTLFLGGMFIAAWSTYGFETAVCYTREFKNPATDTFKAIFWSGMLCIVIYVLVPFTFQGVYGLTGMLEPGVVDGSGIAAALAAMVSQSEFIFDLLVIMILLALVLSIMTAMAGSSRTLYQGSVDGWLPKYLSHVNEHGAPTRAMWTDLTANLIVLSIASVDISSFFYILAVSNCGYIIFNFLNLNAGWMHRVDSANVARPWKAPTFLIVLGTIFAFFNMVFMGAGAKVWTLDPERFSPLWAGFIAAALILPVFCFRHFVQDKGKFPDHMLEDLGMTAGQLGTKKCGVLPYVVLIAGFGVAIASNYIFTL